MPTIYSGGNAVVSSGTIISYNSMPIEITIEPIEKSPYTIVFSFHKDEKKTESYIQAKGLENRVGIEFVLFNFTNSPGTATSQPIGFATANENGISKQLYINFAVNTIGKANPILQYTVYKEM